MEPIETVRIVSPVSDENPHGYVVINRSDLAATDVLFEGAAPQKRSRKPKAEEAAE